LITNILKDKPTKLFIVLGGIFIANALIAEVIGVKLFSLEKLFGQSPFDFTFLGENGLSFTLSAGVLIWPVVFISTDIINEYYGVRGVKFLSYLTASLISMAFIVFYVSIKLPSIDWWLPVNNAKGVPNMQAAFSQILGQGMNIILGSISAFILGQIIDAAIFKKIKKITGEKYIWLRATFSTLVSQFIDSFVVTFIAFYVFQGWTFPKVLAICIVGYSYKFLMAILMTPVVYLVHGIIEKFLGHQLALEMKAAALIKK
jgi:queuosine precursor transporter